MGSDVFLLLHSVEKRKREDEGSCCAPDAQESSCHEMLVFAMGSSGNIRFYDEARLSRRIGRVLVSTWSIRRSIRRSSIRSVQPGVGARYPSFLIACMKQEWGWNV